MRIEKFKQLKVGDKIKFESVDGVLIGTVRDCQYDSHVLVGIGKNFDNSKFYFATPRQVLAKIVKRKKPKLEFVGYSKFTDWGKKSQILGAIFREQRAKDTHEVFVRPIVRKK